MTNLSYKEYGLVPYTKDRFVLFHRAGAGVVTASQMPSLLEATEEPTRFQMLAHIIGASALDEPDPKVVRRGIYFQQAAIDMVAEDFGVEAKFVHAYRRHPEFRRLIASPDGVFAWKGMRGVVEIKVVNGNVYKNDWSNGPPLRVQVQSQTQMACTGAKHAIVIALVWSDYSMEVKEPFVYEARPDVHDVVLTRARFDLELVDKGELPAPHATSSDMTTLLRIQPYVSSAETADMTDDPEANARFLAWKQAQLDRRAAASIEEAHRNWFLHRAHTAGVIKLRDGVISQRSIVRTAHTVPQTTSRLFRLVQTGRSMLTEPETEGI
jgi:hypothetical protein